jgi:uncharacterized membrane protein YdjX (TVP38/TMEM64 family)
MEKPERSGRARVLRLVPLMLVIVLLGAFFATDSHRYFTLESLAGHRGTIREIVSSRPLAALGLYVLIYAAMVTLSIPAAAFMSVAGGFLFGWPLGGAVAALGATSGAASIFLIARSTIGEPLLRRAGPKIQELAANFRADSFSYLLFLRLLPVMPFWITNLAAALFGMRFGTFMAATLLGAIPICYAFAVAGSGLDAAIAAHERGVAECVAAGKNACEMQFQPESLLTPQLMVALGALGILALGPILVRKWQARRREANG